MPRRRALTGAQLENLLVLPAEEITLVRHWTLGDADLAAIGRRRRDHNRLGFALQLCATPAGLRPSEVLPEPALRFVADQVDAAPEAVAAYGARMQTRSAHLDGAGACAGGSGDGPAHGLCDADATPGGGDAHWSREALDSQERLTRALSRERAKDTSLDYGGPEEVAAFAERRGLHPLAPAGDIAVRMPVGEDARRARAEPAREAPPPPLLPAYRDTWERDSLGRGTTAGERQAAAERDRHVHQAREDREHWIGRAYRDPASRQLGPASSFRSAAANLPMPFRRVTLPRHPWLLPRRPTLSSKPGPS
jgi:hypothetical protein